MMLNKLVSYFFGKLLQFGGLAMIGENVRMFRTGFYLLTPEDYGTGEWTMPVVCLGLAGIAMIIAGSRFAYEISLLSENSTIGELGCSFLLITELIIDGYFIWFQIIPFFRSCMTLYC